MKHTPNFWANPSTFLATQNPDKPVVFFSPDLLAQTAQAFLSGFDGLVTYAVKANPDPQVISNLHLAGVCAFDVASPVEIDLVRDHAPGADMHYNNPVRSVAEIKHAVARNVGSYSIDRPSELQKLAHLLPARTAEVSVRLKLPVAGAAYDFGEKFGATPEQAKILLAQVKHLGFTPSMTFHPGTQCNDADAWRSYITVCAEIAKSADVQLHRLNVGGGFPSNRGAGPTDHAEIFTTIKKAVATAFETPPTLVCEPGRAMVSEAFTLATRIKSTPEMGAIFLNDGMYGGLAEFRDMIANERVTVIKPNGHHLCGPQSPFTAFGPTCDSLDVLPNPLHLPNTIAEGDYILFEGMGAYSTSISTAFNGYGDIETVTVKNILTELQTGG